MNNRIVVFPNISVVFFIIFVAFSIIYTGFPGCICRYGKSFTETKRRSEINFTSPAKSSFFLITRRTYCADGGTPGTGFCASIPHKNGI